MKLLPLLLACAAALAGCRNPSAPDSAAGESAGPGAVSGPGPVVTGTVLDARTGKPIANAVVRGPGGIETRSDARGRFLLRGLAPGAAGELVGTTESGLSGRNRLRALEAGALEVVLYLR